MVSSRYPIKIIYLQCFRTRSPAARRTPHSTPRNSLLLPLIALTSSPNQAMPGAGERRQLSRSLEKPVPLMRFVSGSSDKVKRHHTACAMWSGTCKTCMFRVLHNDQSMAL